MLKIIVLINIKTIVVKGSILVLNLGLGLGLNQILNPIQKRKENTVQILRKKVKTKKEIKAQVIML